MLGWLRSSSGRCLLEHEGSAGAGVAALLGEGDGLGDGKRLMCRLCARVITFDAARIQMEGAHEHEKANPAGLLFRIGCFRVAPGCAAHGVAVAEHTWFAGWRWQLAFCGGCQVQLGWAFLGDAGRFYGLILNRLVEEAQRSNE
jgi:hypothetical protein